MHNLAKWIDVHALTGTLALSKTTTLFKTPYVEVIRMVHPARQGPFGTQGSRRDHREVSQRTDDRHDDGPSEGTPVGKHAVPAGQGTTFSGRH